MGFLNIFRAKETKDFLLLDFGRNFICGVIFQVWQVSGKSSIIIKDFQREKVERFAVFDGKDFELDIIKKPAEKVIESLGGRTRVFHLPKIISFSPDIFKAKIFQFSCKRGKKEQRITKAEEDELKKFVFQKAREPFREEKIVKIKLLETKISGYRVSSMLGLKGEQMDFKAMVLFFEKNYFDFLEKLKQAFNLEKAELFHLVEGLERLAILKEGGSFVFLGSKNSLLVSFGPEIEFIADFPIGEEDFKDKLGEALGVSSGMGEVLMEDLFQDKLTPATREKITNILTPVTRAWLDKFKGKMENGKRGFTRQEKIYFFGEGPILLVKKEIEKNFREVKIEEFLPEELPIKNKTKKAFSTKEIPILLLTLVKISS